MRRSDKKALADLLHRMMGDETCAKAVAADIDKPYFTLMSEINGLYADAPRNKLGLGTAVEIMEVSGNAFPLLDWLCNRFGYLPPVQAPSSAATGDALHAMLSRVSEELGDVARELRVATSEDSEGGAGISPAELERLLVELREALAAVLALKAQAQAAVVLPLRERRRGT